MHRYSEDSTYNLNVGFQLKDVFLSWGQPHGNKERFRSTYDILMRVYVNNCVCELFISTFFLIKAIFKMLTSTSTIVICGEIV